MEKNDEIYNVLNNLGLDENEILSIEKRNKFLTTTTEDDVNEVIEFFKIKCNLDEEDLASMVINNPLILNETPERFNMLYEIYNKIGFSSKEYKDYIKNFDRAFSLNPKEVTENIMDLIKNGEKIESIKRKMIDNPHNFFGK